QEALCLLAGVDDLRFAGLELGLRLLEVLLGLFEPCLHGLVVHPRRLQLAARRREGVACRAELLWRGLVGGGGVEQPLAGLVQRRLGLVDVLLDLASLLLEIVLVVGDRRSEGRARHRHGEQRRDEQSRTPRTRRGYSAPRRSVGAISRA